LEIRGSKRLGAEVDWWENRGKPVQHLIIVNVILVYIILSWYFAPRMLLRKDNILLRSFVTGLFISAFLILFQIIFSGKPANGNHVKVTKLQMSSQHPVETKGEAKFSVKSSSLHSTGYIEISREALCLVAVLFKLNIKLDEWRISIPSPLLGYLRTLFTSLISINAP